MDALTSILDPIQNGLTPYLWVGNPAEPAIRHQVGRWLKETIYEELEKFHERPEEWAVLVLTGSLTTWQYSDESDCDVSVFVNPNFMPEWDRARLIGMVVKSIDGMKVQGTPYPLQCFIVSPKVTREMLYQPGLRSGYDLNTDRWLVPPEPNRSHDVQKEYEAWYVYALETIDKLKTLIKHEPRRAADYWKYLHRRRREEESAGKGDYNIFNIIFKMVIAKGLVGDLDHLTGERTAATHTSSELVNEGPIDPLTLSTDRDYSLYSALRNGRFNWKYKGTKRGWSDNQHYYDMEPTGAPAQHEWTGYGKTKRYYYDPELTHPENDQLRANFPLHPHPEWRSTMDFDQDVQPDPNSIYRGMSHEEWEEARQRGYFQSKGDYNIGLGQQGVTLFSTEPGQARSYADSFAPWSLKPGFNHPSYIIGINRPPNARADQVHDEREVVVPGQIPFSAVHSAYQIKPSVIEGGDMSIGTNDGQNWSRWNGGGGFQSTVYRPISLT